MKVVKISELKNQLSAILNLLKKRDSILIVDRDTVVAKIVSITREAQQPEDHQLLRLERAGHLTRGTGKFLKEVILETPPPKLRGKASVLQALLEERAASR